MEDEYLPLLTVRLGQETPLQVCGVEWPIYKVIRYRNTAQTEVNFVPMRLVCIIFSRIISFGTGQPAINGGIKRTEEGGKKFNRERGWAEEERVEMKTALIYPSQVC